MVVIKIIKVSHVNNNLLPFDSAFPFKYKLWGLMENSLEAILRRTIQQQSEQNSWNNEALAQFVKARAEW